MSTFSVTEQKKLIEAEQAAKATYPDVRMRIELANLQFSATLLMHLVPKFLKANK